MLVLITDIVAREELLVFDEEKGALFLWRKREAYAPVILQFERGIEGAALLARKAF